jgi:hypothetical protein
LTSSRGKAGTCGKLTPRSAKIYGPVWQKARSGALTSAQQASPLAARPYDLRHGGITLALNAGVPLPKSPAGQDTASKFSGVSTPAASMATSSCGTTASRKPSTSATKTATNRLDFRHALQPVQEIARLGPPNLPNLFRPCSESSRQTPGTTGNGQEPRRPNANLVGAGQRVFDQVVAGVGFEPT